MKVLVDTNIVLDVALLRPEFLESSSQVLALIEKGRIEGILAATSLTTLHYFTRKHLGPEQARHYVITILALFTIAPVDRDILESALVLEGPDFEDNVIRAAAQRAGAEAIVTRDPKGFAAPAMTSYSPIALLKKLAPVQGTKVDSPS